LSARELETSHAADNRYGTEIRINRVLEKHIGESTLSVAPPLTFSSPLNEMTTGATNSYAIGALHGYVLAPTIVQPL